MRALLTLGLAAALTAGVMAQDRAQLEVGDMAPDFTLEGTDGQTHQLSEYRGQTVVVAWFPKAFTTGCTIECKSLAENGDRIREFDVTYFMASVDNIDDNTAFANATSVDLGGRFGVVEKEEADFPMLADPTMATARAYGVLNTRNVADRWTFYIGPDGRIAAIDKAVNPERSAEDMIVKLQELGTPMMQH
jgi:peroxiredoxin Q/BCP